MSDSSLALSQLSDAITAVRKACAGDPECKVLLSALDTAETAANDYAEGDQDGDDKPVSLADARGKARRMFADSRKEAASTSK